MTPDSDSVTLSFDMHNDRPRGMLFVYLRGVIKILISNKYDNANKKILQPQKRGGDYMIATFPITSPNGKAVVPILTKISPSAILFTRSAMYRLLKDYQ